MVSPTVCVPSSTGDTLHCQQGEFCFPPPPVPGSTAQTTTSATPGITGQPQRYSRPSVDTIEENPSFFDCAPSQPGNTTAPSQTSNTTAGLHNRMEPMHNKNDSYNSINSMETMFSYKLKRFNSASSVPSISTSMDSMSMLSSPTLPSALSLSPTSASSAFKKAAKYALPPAVKLITNTELSLMMTMEESSCLVIDVRPFIEFQNGHVKGAINFNLPSTLLKRSNFTLQKCLNNISLLENVKLANFLKSPEQQKKVVFYEDAAVTNGEVSLGLFGSLNKFLNDESFDGELYVIKTGFPGFKSDFPDLVEVTTQASMISRPQPPHNRSLSLANINGCSSPISPNLSRFQLPKLPKTPVFKIRHNEEFYDFDNYKVMNDFKFLNCALSNGTSDKVPQWFHDLVQKNNTLSLIEKFKNLEIQEKRRINEMISTNSVGSGIELGFKNRYKDIFPYEHSRVKLAVTPTQETHGYINANFINAPHLSQMRYIATQAPLESTTRDFAKLCHDNSVSLIISLTNQFENGVEKCYPYWDDSSNFELVETMKLDDLILRRLKMPGFDEEVLQIQILNWSDYDVMINHQQSDVLKLIYLKSMVLNKLGKSDDNVIVHCSAGCGRTGTFCTLDSIINEDFASKGELKSRFAQYAQFDPVFEIVESFRNQRISMVQNLRQYLFIYDCLLNYYENFNQFEVDGFHELNGLEILDHYFHDKTH